MKEPLFLYYVKYHIEKIDGNLKTSIHLLKNFEDRKQESQLVPIIETSDYIWLLRQELFQKHDSFSELCWSMGKRLI